MFTKAEIAFFESADISELSSLQQEVLNTIREKMVTCMNNAETPPTPSKIYNFRLRVRDINRYKPIQAIKMLRTLCPTVGLKEAKDIIEGVRDNNKPSEILSTSLDLAQMWNAFVRASDDPPAIYVSFIDNLY